MKISKFLDLSARRRAGLIPARPFDGPSQRYEFIRQPLVKTASPRRGYVERWGTTPNGTLHRRRRDAARATPTGRVQMFYVPPA